MSRFYHDGAEHALPLVEHPIHGSALTVPPLFRARLGTHVRVQPNSMVLPIVGYDLYVVPSEMPDGSRGFVDLPDDLTVDAVKALAPSLLTAAEWEKDHASLEAAAAKKPAVSDKQEQAAPVAAAASESSPKTETPAPAQAAKAPDDKPARKAPVK